MYCRVTAVVWFDGAPLSLTLRSVNVIGICASMAHVSTTASWGNTAIVMMSGTVGVTVGGGAAFVGAPSASVGVGGAAGRPMNFPSSGNVPTWMTKAPW